MDNVFIERVWRSVKYEDIYLKEYARTPDLRAGLSEWFERYNTWRPRGALGNQTPAVVHLELRKKKEGEVPIEEAMVSTNPGDAGEFGRADKAPLWSKVPRHSSSLIRRERIPFQNRVRGKLYYFRFFLR